LAASHGSDNFDLLATLPAWVLDDYDILENRDNENDVVENKDLKKKDYKITDPANVNIPANCKIPLTM
jgi:hypothetical protein